MGEAPGEPDPPLPFTLPPPPFAAGGEPERERERDSRLTSCPLPFAPLWAGERAGDLERDLLVFLSLLLERDLLRSRSFVSFLSLLGDGERDLERGLADRDLECAALRERRLLRRGERLLLRLRSLLRERLRFLLLRSLLRERERFLSRLRERVRFLSRLRERDLEREPERLDERRGDLLPS